MEKIVYGGFYTINRIIRNKEAKKVSKPQKFQSKIRLKKFRLF